ncbi:MAG: hypothetical protein JWL76_2438 [Thermoleophilia bacterium]|nr:hypothetical protein [Thermoleophilia bacterium]
MNLVPAFPRPAALPPFSVTPAFDLARDAERLDRLPPEIEESGIQLPLRSTTKWGDDQEWPIDDWYASASQYDEHYRMKRDGLVAAIAGARELAKGTEAVAVVQSTDGGRYLVPLGVWNPVDESQLSFDDAGGTPYFRSKADNVQLGRNEGSADVEAVVFGDEWINLTGHPVQLPAS